MLAEADRLSSGRYGSQLAAEKLILAAFRPRAAAPRRSLRDQSREGTRHRSATAISTQSWARPRRSSAGHVPLDIPDIESCVSPSFHVGAANDMPRGSSNDCGFGDGDAHAPQQIAQAILDNVSPLRHPDVPRHPALAARLSSGSRTARAPLVSSPTCSVERWRNASSANLDVPRAGRACAPSLLDLPRSGHRWLFVRDGGFSMLMAEFANYRLPVKVVVKNDALGEIKWEQRVFLGNLEYGCELHLIDFAAFARAGDGTGLTIPRPRRVSVPSSSAAPHDQDDEGRGQHPILDGRPEQERHGFHLGVVQHESEAHRSRHEVASPMPAQVGPDVEDVGGDEEGARAPEHPPRVAASDDPGINGNEKRAVQSSP